MPRTPTDAPREAEPTGEGERLITLDVLRGFALFGVLLVNLEFWFRTTPLRLAQRAARPPGLADRIVDVLLPALFEGRFIGLFALLFGAGLAAQADRRAARGARVGPFLARRMGVLFVLGVLHVLLLWSGDILHLYAIVGLLLSAAVLGRRQRTIAVALGCLLALPVVIAAIVSIAAPASAPAGAPEDPALAAKIDALVHTMRHGSWMDIARARLDEYVEFLPKRAFGLGSSLLMASLGVLVWRTGVLARPREHRRALRWALIVGSTYGLGQAVLHALLKRTPVLAEAATLRRLVANCTPSAHASMVLAYAAALVLLLEHPRARRALVFLAAAGRMALTNYLLQSVIGSLLFFGFGLGLYDRLGLTTGALLVVAVYLAQVALSNAWLRRFRFGPVEWAWRSLTYGRAPPMRAAGRAPETGSAPSLG
ncbi:MAG: DUF418 domain-containing protein [Polyangiaceae bacterium]|nr:DUF418 domain-containing protein [Polyangiaceae bacterium]